MHCSFCEILATAGEWWMDKLRSKCQLRLNSQRMTKKAAAKWASGQTAAAAAVSLLLPHSAAATAVIRSRTRRKVLVKVAKGGRQANTKQYFVDKKY